MRNLKVLKANLTKSHNFLSECKLYCVDTTDDNVYFVNEEYIVGYRSDEHGQSDVLKIPLESSLERDVISAEYLCELNSICFGTTTGDLTTFCIPTQQVEVVGSVTCGLKAVSWSPDQEVIALVTGLDNVLLMTKDFDPVVEKYLHPDDFGENKPITAGWGAKETQFHGSEGKGARNIKQVLEPVPSWDKKVPAITWTGDSQLFAISAVHPRKEVRQIRIWTREGDLLCTSEDVSGLCAPISWRPSGSLIAGVRRTTNKHDIVFFEKNGLLHGEFSLPFQEDADASFHVNGLSWNSDSSILAVWGESLGFQKDSFANQRMCKVMLWTTSNYHWFLKITLNFENNEVSCLQWDVIDPYILRISGTNEGFFVTYSLYWTTDKSLGHSQEDLAFVAVIDGTNVNVTPYGRVTVPPPLYAYSLLCSYPVNQVVFGPPSCSYDVIALSADNKLTRFSYSSGNKWKENQSSEKYLKLGAVGGNGSKIQVNPHYFIEEASIKWDRDLNFLSTTCCSHLWLWVTKDQLVCAVPNGSGGDFLFCLNLTEKSNDRELHARFCSEFNSAIYAMCLLEETVIAVELSDGLMFKFDLDSCIASPWETEGGLHLKIPQPSPSIAIYKIGKQDHILALSKRNRFFCNYKELLNNCTSFMIHKEFLLLTTHSHNLRCLHLQNDLPKLLQSQSSTALEECPRSLERGSRLVTSVSSETRVILQMPRGNLEVIHPRTLLLHTLAELLNSLEYNKALQLMRRNRINLNLLHDHDPKAFMTNAETFVRDVDSPSFINLFLVDLSEEDVTKKMYSSAYRYIPRLEEDHVTSKVDAVCERLQTALANVDEHKFLLSIITTHAKKTTPELDIALQKIKALRDLGPETEALTSGALEHLLYIADVNHLYDIALGTYDFDIVLMVAEKSQKDPKEFLQFFNSLKLLEPNYQKYKIDMHLRRYKKALLHISNCGDDHLEECLDLIKVQKLYRDALHIFPAGSPQNKQIWQLYGEYLLSKRQLEEAGLAFQRSECYEQALSAHRGALQWEMALYDAQLLGYRAPQISQLAKALAESLKLSGRYSDAATILEQYAEDEEESIATLVDGQLWSMALLKINQYKRSDLLETHLKPSLVEGASNVTCNIEQMHQDFLQLSKRLRDVRETKRKAEMEPAGDEEGDYHVAADGFSETSSVTGLSQNSAPNTIHSGSIATRRTSRNKQKQERKKYTLKEGSRFEDLALISALSDIIRSADDLRDNCSKMLKALVLLGFHQEAQLLQQKMTILLLAVESSLSSIWPPEDGTHTTNAVIELGPATTSNILAASLQQQKHKPVISDPSLRIPPNFRKEVEWKLFMLDK